MLLSDTSFAAYGALTKRETGVEVQRSFEFLGVCLLLCMPFEVSAISELRWGKKTKNKTKKKEQEEEEEKEEEEGREKEVASSVLIGRVICLRGNQKQLICVS